VLRYIVKRIAQAIPLLIVICVLCFALIQLAPFDAIDTVTTPDMPPEVVNAIKQRYGLDQSPVVQFLAWARGILTGDFGYSLINHQSVAFGLSARLPNTILLVLPSYTLAVLLSLLIGLVAGAHRGGRFDKCVDALCSIGMATPSFWIGMILLYVFAYALRWLPMMGMHTLGQAETLPDLIRHMALPCTVLTINFLPGSIRYVRSSTISQYKEDYVTVQKAYGAGRLEILFRHVMKNALLPIITLVCMSLPTLVTGAFITESIFSWPGVGTYFLTAIRAFDYPVIMVILLLSSAMVILGNLLADVLYCLVDPRIKSMR
jgi:peptide/nickel transport system permease protein